MNQLTTSIISQFVAEAAFLWVLRSRLVDAPHFSLQDLAQLDERLEAHLDGLRVAGEAGWGICRDALDGQYAETFFPAAVLAFESGDKDRIQVVIESLNNDPACAKALISALGWLTYEQAAPLIEKLLTDQSAYLRYIGIAACAIHRHDPGQHLNKAACHVYPLLIARALQAYGELGRSCELDNYNLPNLLADSDNGIRFAAAWSASIAGIPAAVETLKSFAATEAPYSVKALNTALRQMEQTAAITWQKQLADSPATIRLATIGAGVIGDTILVPWLIEQMKTPQLARIAGEAFTLITGIDNELDEMKGAQLEGFTAGPNDDAKDDNVALDADENLPWPNAGLIAAWWDNNKGNYPSGTRYLLGKTVTVDHLRQVLKTGLQRQRSAAALELAILQPGRPLFDVRARGCRQLAAGGSA
ncbi:TIGR02270 family protein [Pelotalea chapellei]|uniref:TIGR02270 family protein n=1 Tax=Pelotalea chapellei TaxID=44671 RepID=A0ABS5UAU7_9BACT|nr:TIGR02270 family protein [Pelotalea chapellei]